VCVQVYYNKMHYMYSLGYYYFFSFLGDSTIELCSLLFTNVLLVLCIFSFCLTVVQCLFPTFAVDRLFHVNLLLVRSHQAKIT